MQLEGSSLTVPILKKKTYANNTLNKHPQLLQAIAQEPKYWPQQARTQHSGNVLVKLHMHFSILYKRTSLN